MGRFVLLVAICGIAGIAGADTAQPTAPREWTDASGTKRAHATLLRVDGETLWLRRTDGKLTTTTIAKLSERDRQFVATRRPQLAAGSESPSLAAAVGETVTDAVESIQELPRWLGQSQLGAGSSPIPAAPVPAALVYVRVSQDFLEDYVERTVRRRKEVRDCVLGTRIVGESETRGKTRLTLIPSNDQLKAHIAFEGTVRARTRGYHGPVVLHNISDSTFHARKFVAMDDAGLRVAPSTATASTDLRTTSISSSLPRLRGRIATRIAWRRVSQSRGRAEAITADHTADDIRSDFDARIDRSMANVQTVLGAKIVKLEAGTSPMPTDVRFRCRTEYLEMAIIREDATAEERKLRPPPAHEDSDVSVRVHRTLLTSAIEDPQLIQTLAPLFVNLLESRAKQETKDAGISAKAVSDAAPRWVMDQEWASLDFKAPNR